MQQPRLGTRVYPVTPAVRRRHRFGVLAAVTTVALLGWGAFVTSINAGMAVPDWPSSFNSFDPFNPWPEWWTITPVLAEHGHRLLGALVGLFTVVLALWTWRADPRRWMRRLGFAALVLVILQGTLGGLRVVFASLDLAVVHACVAQIYFSLIVAMALFTAPRWLRAEGLPAGDTGRLRTLALLTAGLLYGQIILGALLRHPGTGIDPVLAGLHITGAFAVAAAVITAFVHARRHHASSLMVRRAAAAMLGLLVLQVALGFTAYFVTLDESGVLQPSNVQVIVNSAHMVVGALLMASSVALALLAFRGSAAAPQPARPVEGVLSEVS